MNNHLNILWKQAKFDLKCSKMRWGAYDAPPDPLTVCSFAPKALAIRRLEADPPAFLVKSNPANHGRQPSAVPINSAYLDF